MFKMLLVTYQLVGDNDIESFNKLLEYEYGGLQLTDSSWLISTIDECSCKEIADNLLTTLSNKSRIFVAELGETAAGMNPIAEYDLINLKYLAFTSLR